MKFWHCLAVAFLTLASRHLGITSPPANPSKLRPVPKASSQASEKLKKAFAAYSQGNYEQAIELAIDVYKREGNVRARWWQSWVFRYVGKENLPDPYDFDAIRRMWVEGMGHLATGVRGARPAWILALSYLELGNYEEAVKWAKLIGGQILYDAQELYRRYGLKAQQVNQPPPKHTWRPLPLKFREEDYFILVPLDQACKVLGIPFRYKVNPKTGKRTGAQIGEKGLISLMGRPFARNIKGEIDDMAYAPFEEDGVVWVPFYWLAKQAGIRWWEVRDGKIYIAPK